jgi:carbon-monoxide dehydrogenase medium subunit
MKPPEFRYRRATSLPEALEMLAADPDGTKVLAGGQSLMPVLGMRLAEPEVLLDISRIPELVGAAAAPDGRLRYGACTVHADVEDGRVPDVTNGLLPTVAAGIGYRAIRNRGTMGGSLAHADPSAEWPVVMAALDAMVQARSATGDREIPCAELADGYFTTALRAEEILAEIRLRPVSPGMSWGFCKIARKVGEFAESIAVAVIDHGTARVWLGGAAGTPLQLTGVQEAVDSGVDLAQPDVVQLVSADLRAAGAPDAGDEYRRHLHGVSCWRAVRDALAGTLNGRHREAS